MELVIFAGSGNPALADSIADRLGVPLGGRLIHRFPDGELHVEIRETVRGSDVYLFQSTGPPVDEHFIELLFLADACRRAGAERLTAITPYFGYARQDRRASGREAIGVRLMADLLDKGGFHRVVAVDLHSAALESVFSVALEHLSAVGLLANVVEGLPAGPSVVVAPDLGAVKLAERYARILHLPMAIVHKTRISGAEVKAHGIVGEVRDRAPLVVDDMISTGGTIEAALKALAAAGCGPEAIVIATHALLVGPAIERLAALHLKRLIVSDSLALPAALPLPVQRVSLAPLLAEVVSRLHVGESLGELVSHG